MFLHQLMQTKPLIPASMQRVHSPETPQLLCALVRLVPGCRAYACACRLTVLLPTPECLHIAQGSMDPGQYPGHTLDAIAWKSRRTVLPVESYSVGSSVGQ